MILKALICDDDSLCADSIEKYFYQYCEEHDIRCKCDKFYNSKDAMEAIDSDEVYTIAFLDIEIDEKSGLDIAKYLNKKNNKIIIIYITAFQKYIDDAMDLYAVRFLEKPFDHVRLYSGLDRAVKIINEMNIQFCISNDAKGCDRVFAKDIIYIEIQPHKTKVVTVDKQYISNKSIDQWDNELLSDDFVRIHKSFIVNLNHVDLYNDSIILLGNGERIPVAYRNGSRFKKKFAEHLNRRK